jgi:hypothetical protein
VPEGSWWMHHVRGRHLVHVTLVSVSCIFARAMKALDITWDPKSE